jgi:hypothetical protein
VSVRTLPAETQLIFPLFFCPLLLQMQRLSKSMPLAEQRNVAEGLRVKLEQFKSYIPIVASVCNPGIMIA